MTGAEDRLAAIVREHHAQYEDYFFICDCGEKWPALAECLDEEVAAHERHIAQAIAVRWVEFEDVEYATPVCVAHCRVGEMVLLTTLKEAWR